MGFNPAQEAIIRHEKGSLLVSAAAGSGKTSTLVAHVVRRILQGGDLRRLIIVTYTRAAAGEMRERIRQTLEKALWEQPENRHLRHQLTLLGQASIATVDSLCGQLVHAHFQSLPDCDLPPDLRIGEEAELKLLGRDTAEEILEEAYAAPTEDFYALLDAYSSEKNHEEIIKMIQALHDSAQNDPFPDEWLAQALPHFPKNRTEAARTPWIRSVTEEIHESIRRVLARQEALIRHLKADGEAHGAMLSLLEEEYRQVETLLEVMEYDRLREGLKSLKFVPLTRKELKEDPAFDLVKEQRGGLSSQNGAYLEMLAALRKEAPIPLEEELRLMDLTLPSARALLSMTRLYGARLGEACRSRGIASFMDMEHYALGLLTRRDEAGGIIPSPLARELQAGLDEIIVDEYQDINRVQEMILRMLSGEESGRPNLFMVGDVKQSIYRFRRAEPTIFIEKYESFSEEEQADHRKILLKDNYRSRRAVLNSANALFRRMMSRTFGGVDYDDSVALRAGAQYEGEDVKPQVLLLYSEKRAEERLKQEGRMLAQTIGRIMEEGPSVRDRNEKGETYYRPLAYRDMVILTQTLNNAALFAKVLKEYGIPASAQESRGFYETMEVQTTLSLLAVLNNPRQDIPLAAVLLSPFGGFTEGELALYLAQQGRRCLYDRIKEIPPEALGGRFAAFLQRLEAWRREAGIRSVPDLLDYLMADSGYELYLMAMASGPVRLANLRQLKEMARSYEKSSYRGLHQFLRYVERQKDLKIDIGEAPLQADGRDVVRIGTLHSSKGLEYPVVFLAGLGKGFNETELKNPPYLIQTEEGLALKTQDRESLMRWSNLWYRHVQKTLRKESRGEALRLLYVGMTRAMERLYLSLTPDKDPLDEKVIEKYRQAFPEDASSLGDWLLQAYCRGDHLQMDWHFMKEEDLAEPEAALWQERQWMPIAATPREREEEEALLKRLSLIYPHPQLPRISYSVSELKEEGLKKAAPAAPARHSSLHEENEASVLTAAEKGTAFHKLMEHLPLEQEMKETGIRAYLEKALQRGILTEAEAKSLDLEAAAQFFLGEPGGRALQAAARGRLFREKPFILGVPYREIQPDIDSEELALVQGIIDMYYEEEDGSVLIDYKTDRVSRPEMLTERYAIQMAYYVRALEAATGRKVKEVYLYSVFHRRFVPCPVLDK